MRYGRDKIRTGLRVSKKNTEPKMSKLHLPLQNKAVYMDIKNGKLAESMEEQLKQLGAKVEKFFSHEVNYVISSSASLKVDEKAQKEDNPQSPSFIPSPFNCAPSPAGTSESRAAVISRGKALAQIACAQNKASTAVANAEKLGIKVVSVEVASKWLDKEMKKLGIKCAKDSDRKENTVKKAASKQKDKVQSKSLKGSFLKFEASNCHYKPVKVEFDRWPRLNLTAPPGICPFGEAKLKVQQHYRACNIPTQVKVVSAGGKVNKTREMIAAVKHADAENRPDQQTAAAAMPAEQLVGVPIVAAGDTRYLLNFHFKKNLAINKQQGYCDCCGVRFHNMNEHVKCEDHRAFARQKCNYEGLDSLISQLPTTANFLQSVLLKHCAHKHMDPTEHRQAPVGNLAMMPVISSLATDKTNILSRGTADACITPHPSGYEVSPFKDHMVTIDIDLKSRQERTPTKNTKLPDSRSPAVVIRRPLPSGMFTSPGRRQLTPSKKAVVWERSMVFRDSSIASLQPTPCNNVRNFSKLVSDNTLGSKHSKLRRSKSCSHKFGGDSGRTHTLNPAVLQVRHTAQSMTSLHKPTFDAGDSENVKSYYSEILKDPGTPEGKTGRKFSAKEIFVIPNHVESECWRGTVNSPHKQNAAAAVGEVTKEMDASHTLGMSEGMPHQNVIFHKEFPQSGRDSEDVSVNKFCNEVLPPSVGKAMQKRSDFVQSSHEFIDKEHVNHDVRKTHSLQKIKQMLSKEMETSDKLCSNFDRIAVLSAVHNVDMTVISSDHMKVAETVPIKHNEVNYVCDNTVSIVHNENNDVGKTVQMHYNEVNTVNKTFPMYHNEVNDAVRTAEVDHNDVKKTLIEFDLNQNNDVEKAVIHFDHNGAENPSYSCTDPPVSTSNITTLEATPVLVCGHTLQKSHSNYSSSAEATANVIKKSELQKPSFLELASLGDPVESSDTEILEFINDAGCDLQNDNIIDSNPPLSVVKEQIINIMKPQEHSRDCNEETGFENMIVIASSTEAVIPESCVAMEGKSYENSVLPVRHIHCEDRYEVSDYEEILKVIGPSQHEVQNKNVEDDNCLNSHSEVEAMLKSTQEEELNVTTLKSTQEEELNVTTLKSTQEEKLTVTALKSTQEEELNVTALKSTQEEKLNVTALKSTQEEELNVTALKSTQEEELRAVDKADLESSEDVLILDVKASSRVEDAHYYENLELTKSCGHFTFESIEDGKCGSPYVSQRKSGECVEFTEHKNQMSDSVVVPNIADRVKRRSRSVQGSDTRSLEKRKEDQKRGARYRGSETVLDSTTAPDGLTCHSFDTSRNWVVSADRQSYNSVGTSQSTAAAVDKQSFNSLGTSQSTLVAAYRQSYNSLGTSQNCVIPEHRQTQQDLDCSHSNTEPADRQTMQYLGSSHNNKTTVERQANQRLDSLHSNATETPAHQYLASSYSNTRTDRHQCINSSYSNRTPTERQVHQRLDISNRTRKPTERQLHQHLDISNSHTAPTKRQSQQYLDISYTSPINTKCPANARNLSPKIDCDGSKQIEDKEMGKPSSSLIVPNIAECVKKRRSCTLFNHEGQYANSGEGNDGENQRMKVEALSAHKKRSKPCFISTHKAAVVDIELYKEDNKILHGLVNKHVIQKTKDEILNEESGGISKISRNMEKTEDELADSGSAIVIRRRKSRAYPAFLGTKRPDVDWGMLNIDDCSILGDDSKDSSTSVEMQINGEKVVAHKVLSIPSRGLFSNLGDEIIQLEDVINGRLTEDAISGRLTDTIRNVNFNNAVDDSVKDEALVTHRARYRKARQKSRHGSSLFSGDSQIPGKCSKVVSSQSTSNSPRLKLKIKRQPNNEGYSSTLEEIFDETPDTSEFKLLCVGPQEENTTKAEINSKCKLVHENLSARTNNQHPANISWLDQPHALFQPVVEESYKSQEQKRLRLDDTDSVFHDNSDSSKTPEYPIKYSASRTRVQLFSAENIREDIVCDENESNQNNSNISPLHNSNFVTEDQIDVPTTSSRPQSPCFSSPFSKLCLKSMKTSNRTQMVDKSAQRSRSPVFKTSIGKSRQMLESKSVDLSAHSSGKEKPPNMFLPVVSLKKVALDVDIALDSSGNTVSSVDKDAHLDHSLSPLDQDFPSAKRQKLDDGSFITKDQNIKNSGGSGFVTKGQSITDLLQNDKSTGPGIFHGDRNSVMTSVSVAISRVHEDKHSAMLQFHRDTLNAIPQFHRDAHSVMPSVSFAISQTEMKQLNTLECIGDADKHSNKIDVHDEEEDMDLSSCDSKNGKTQAELDGLLTLVSRISSPGKLSDSSWGETCDSYLSTSVNRQGCQTHKLAASGKQPSKDTCNRHCSVSLVKLPEIFIGLTDRGNNSEVDKMFPYKQGN